MRLLFSSRFFISTMCFLALLFTYVWRVNMSVAIVCMVNNTAMQSKDNEYRHISDRDRSNISLHDRLATENGTSASDFYRTTAGASLSSSSRHRSSECGAWNISETNERDADGPFLWTKQQQGTILGAFYWGYLVLQIPSGWVVRKFGSVRLFGVSALLSSVFCLLTPLLASYSYMAVVVIRVCTGLVHGSVCPAIHNLLSNWLPPHERATMGSFVFGGMPLGVLVAFVGSGFLCKYGFGDGWQSVFYVYGCVGLVFTLSWWLLVNESPTLHKRINVEEKRYIQSYVVRETKKEQPLVTPWKSILTSLPVLVIVLVGVSTDFFGIAMLLFLPMYLKDVMHFDISSNGLMSSLPYMMQGIVLILSGHLSDFVMKKRWLSIGVARKVFNTIGQVICITFVIAVGFLDCHQASLAVVFIIMGVTGLSFLGVGYYINPLDIAPSYSGLIIAMANTAGTAVGVMASYIVPAVNGENPSQESWQIVFTSAAALVGVSLVFYVIFASGNVQPWARESSCSNAPFDVELDKQPDEKDGSGLLNNEPT